jgi:hypothetical protein
MARTAAVLGSALAFLVAVPIGCSDAPVTAPELDPEEAARQAMVECDANQDGSLDAAELERCPGLRAAQAAMDADGNGQLTESEIADRIESYVGDELVVTTFPCHVLFDGRPLVGAEVTLVPESFLGPALKPAAGVTGEGGNAVLSVPEVQEKGFAGVYCGLYRIQISLRNAAGAELVPAKYNTQTTLGQEVAPGVRELDRGVTLNLSSR